MLDDDAIGSRFRTVLHRTLAGREANRRAGICNLRMVLTCHVRGHARGGVPRWKALFWFKYRMAKRRTSQGCPMHATTSFRCNTYHAQGYLSADPSHVVPENCWCHLPVGGARILALSDHSHVNLMPHQALEHSWLAGSVVCKRHCGGRAGAYPASAGPAVPPLAKSMLPTAQSSNTTFSGRCALALGITCLCRGPHFHRSFLKHAVLL